MLNQIKNQIESAINNCKILNCDYFVIIRNSDDDIKRWNGLGYDVQYDMEYFNNIENMFDFINGKSTYNYIDNSVSLNNINKIFYNVTGNATALFYGTKNGEIISLM